MTYFLSNIHTMATFMIKLKKTVIELPISTTFILLQ